MHREGAQSPLASDCTGRYIPVVSMRYPGAMLFVLGAIVSPSAEAGDDFLAPGANIGAGIDFHPNGRPLGISVGARLHVAGRPMEDVLAGAGFLVLGIGVVYR
jgi:hypothetical protein